MGLARTFSNWLSSDIGSGVVDGKVAPSACSKPRVITYFLESKRAARNRRNIVSNPYNSLTVQGVPWTFAASNIS